MKFEEIIYSKTFTIGEHWEKVGFRITPEGETPEEILDAAHEKAQSWHLNKNKDFYQKLPWEVPSQNIPLHKTIADEEWERIKEKINEFEFREEAQEYINTTAYAMTIEAKKLINQKPLKSKQ